MSPRLARWGARAALLGGALSVLVGLLALVNPGYYLFESPPDLLVPVAEAVALLAILGGIVGLRAVQGTGRLLGAGSWISTIGLVAAGVGHLIGLPFFVFVDTGGMAYVLIGLSQGIPLVWGTVYVIGTFLFSAGIVLFGLATFRDRTLPFWCGPALIAGLAGLWMLGNTLGWISFGLAWLAAGYALRSSAARDAGSRPPRVR